MKKSLIVKQDGLKECGAASLLSIIRYYNGNISISRLIELTETDNQGTSFYNLKKAGISIGLEAIGYKVEEFDNLKEIKKPFICQFINNNYEHFVAVYKVNKDKVIIMDPAFGEKKLTKEEFCNLWTSYIMIFSPQKKLVQYKEKKYLNKIIEEVIKSNKTIVLGILTLSIIFSIISFMCTMYFEIVLDFLLETTINNLLAITFIFSCLYLLRSITNFFRNELLIILNQKLDCSSFLYTFQRILLLPYSYYKNRTTGEIISRINDLIYVKNILNKIILTVCLDTLICIGCSMILFIKNKLLFSILLITILIYVILYLLFKPRLKKYTEITQENSAQINSFLTETISGFETIKNMHLESIINNKLETIYLNALNDNFQYENISNLEIFMKDIITYIGILLVHFIGFTLVMRQEISIGNFLTMSFLTNYMIDPIKNILDLNKEYYYATNSIKRANNMLEIESENLEKKSNYSLKGNILLNNLNFSYKTDSLTLNNINLKIEANEKVMILGQSGSGKSTIIKLILKYYEANRNNIYLDEFDINDLTISNIREQISCITQNEILFNDTIRNNIIMGRKINEEEFQEVVKLTHINDFTKNLFLGLDTNLEENGLNLSGGERQRIILARMLLKKSKIIIIDEGLNAIDINLERIILKNIFLKYQDKTIVVVSHRTENQDLFEHIILMENGRIKKDLKYRGGIYDRQIYNTK